MDIEVAESWQRLHGAARVGVLALGGVTNPPRHAALDARAAEIAAAVRARFAGRTRAELADLPVMRAYRTFYRPFNKSYHVLFQAESVALKGKTLASDGALVQAMFMAEVDRGLLTAGHDLDAVAAPLVIAAANGEETYTRINGQAQTLQAGDMYMADARGVLSSVIYGPDARTRITPATRRVLFVTYAPAGIGEPELRAHLTDIEAYVRLVAPGAERETLAVCPG